MPKDWKDEVASEMRSNLKFWYYQNGFELNQCAFDFLTFHYKMLNQDQRDWLESYIEVWDRMFHWD